MLAFLVLGFVMLGALRRLDLVWLHPTPMKPYLDVIAWDASLWCWLLHAYPFPFRSVRCYACHTCLCHPLAFYASLHACLHVHAWVLLASVSSILQYNEAMDIRSKPTFVPRGHHLLFAFLLVCLPSCLLACLFAFLLSYLFILWLVMSPAICYACHVYHTYLFYASFTCSLHFFPSIACLLVSSLCICMYTHGARKHGARAQAPKRKQKGWGCKHVDISQLAMFSWFRGLAFPIWLCTILNPLPSFLLSFLDGLY